MSVTNRRIEGHGLVAEGAAFSDDGSRRYWNTTGGSGYGLCACGEMSGYTKSAAARKRWHRSHKFDALTAEPDPGLAVPARVEPTEEVAVAAEVETT